MNSRGLQEYKEKESPFAFNTERTGGHQQYENDLSERPFAFNTSPGGHRQYNENDSPPFAFNTERRSGHHQQYENENENERPFAFNTSPGGHRQYNENEDPFGLNKPERRGGGRNENEDPFGLNKPERRGGGRANAGRTDSYSFSEATTVSVPAERAGSFERNAAIDKRLHRLRVWNTGFRFATFVLCVSAVIFVASSRQTSSKIEGADGKPSKATFRFSGSFIFFLYVNVTVAGYALVLSICAFVVGRKGESQTTPISLMWPALILNVVHATFLLLAFAVALSVDVVSRHGLTLGSVIWEPLCHYYDTFCTLNEIALSASAAAYLCLLAGTCIDGYCIHVFT